MATAAFTWMSTGELHALVESDLPTHRVVGGYSGSIAIPLLVDGRPGVYFHTSLAGGR